MMETEIRAASPESKLECTLTIVYFAVSIVEMFAEYFRNIALIYWTKPLILPLLAFLYIRTSPKFNRIYIAALIFSWLANLFFVSQHFEDIFIGAILYAIYRMAAIYIIIRETSLPGFLPVVVGSVPFLFIYLYLINLTYDAIGEGLPIFIAQCIMISMLGGLSVGYFMFKSSPAATFLLSSTLFFVVTQFIFVIRLFYINVNIFQPMAMAFFVIGQYLFYKFLVLSEKEKKLANG